MSPEPAPSAPGDDLRVLLQADCSRCTGLCCMVPAFGVSADFPIDKPAGVPCPNLEGHRCGIHARLRDEGFRGCVTFDCIGAGQHVTEVSVQGRDWRTDARTAAQVRAVFPVARRLSELRWYLAEAIEIAGTGALGDALAEADRETGRLLDLGPEAMSALDVGAHHARVDPFLVDASGVALAGHAPGEDLRGADLAGADLRARDLRGAVLRGAVLVGADLRGVDLAAADLTGADLRGADVRGADLSSALFVTRPQLTSARGDGATRVPPLLERPAHWLAGA